MRLDALEQVARALNAAAVPFIVVGGVAVVAHGYARGTQDVDLVVRLDSATIHRAFAALASVGYRPIVPVTADQFADPVQRQGWARDRGMTVLSFASEQYRFSPVDVFVTEPFDFAAEFARALTEEIAAGVPIRIVRLSTLVRLKQAVGRPQDLADIAELRRLHGARCDE